MDAAHAREMSLADFLLNTTRHVHRSPRIGSFMQSTVRIAALVLLSLCVLASNGIAQAASTTAPQRIEVFPSIATRAVQLLHAVRALETEILASVPRITWGQIKAKYHDSNNPKGQ